MEQEIILFVKTLVEVLGPWLATVIVLAWIWVKYGKGKVVVISGHSSSNGNVATKEGGNGRMFPNSPFITEAKHDLICASRIEEVRGDIKALSKQIEMLITIRGD